MVLTKDILTELLVFSQACWNYRLPVDCGIQRLLILCFLSCMLGSIVSSWRAALSSCTSLRLLPGHLPCRCSSRVAVRLNLVVREISFNMQGGWRYWRGLRKCLDTRKRGLWKDCWARRGGSENLYTSKPTHDIIIQIGRFSTQQFNDPCNSAILRGLQI